MRVTPTKEGVAKYRYGGWSGNPKGDAYDPGYCAEEIMRGFHFGQCSRPPGHGPDALFCRQHAKRYVSSSPDQKEAIAK